MNFLYKYILIFVILFIFSFTIQLHFGFCIIIFIFGYFQIVYKLIKLLSSRSHQGEQIIDEHVHMIIITVLVVYYCSSQPKATCLCLGYQINKGIKKEILIHWCISGVHELLPSFSKLTHICSKKKSNTCSDWTFLLIISLKATVWQRIVRVLLVVERMPKQVAHAFQSHALMLPKQSLCQQSSSFYMQTCFFLFFFLTMGEA